MIAIVTPSQDDVKAGFCNSLVGLLWGCFRDGISVYHHNVRNTLLPAARNAGVDLALKKGASHILWLDSDIEFPDSTLNRLLAHNKDIAGATHMSRRSPFAPVHRELAEIDSRSLAQVIHLPAACVLVKTDVYKRLTIPYYRFSVKDTEIVGEDVDFCWRTNELGYSIWLDRVLSKEIVHLGEGRFVVGAEQCQT